MYFNFLKWEHLASYHPLSKVYTAKKAEYSLLELKKHPKKVQVIIIYVYYDTINHMDHMVRIYSA